MNTTEQARFNPLFENMQRALKLQGKAKATKDAYARIQTGHPNGVRHDIWRIELNPLRAGMVPDPGDYPWSSYRHNAQGESGTLLFEATVG